MATAQTSWTGAASSAWADAANWTAGVPTSTVDATVPAGTPFSPDTAGASAVCRSLVVDLGANVTVDGASPLDVEGDLTVDGTVGGAGNVRMVGTAWADLLRAAALPDLEVAKASGAVLFLRGPAAVTGDLRVTSGRYIVSASGSHTMTVGGHLYLDGGSLEIERVGTLDVAGSVVHTGTTVAAHMPTIRFAGDWTNGAAFAPTGGLAVSTGASATLTGAPLNFVNLTVATGASATATSDLTVSTNLIVDGTLIAGAGCSSMVIGLDLTVNGGLDGGSADLAFGRDVRIPGTYTGTGVARANTASWGSIYSGTFANLEVARLVECAGRALGGAKATKKEAVFMRPGTPEAENLCQPWHLSSAF